MTLELFIPDFKEFILLTPSIVKWPLASIILATSTKSKRSLFFIPSKGLVWKKGIIFSVKSGIFLTVKIAMPDFSTTLWEPQPKSCSKPANK